MKILMLVALLVLAPSLVLAQPAGENRETDRPGSAGPKGGGAAVQRSTQPDPGDVRPGNRNGDNPSAAAGDVVPRTGHRVLGLPVTAALILGGIIVVLLIIAGIVIPETRRRARARGNGTYGPRS
jgi:hypothetical protein